MSTTARRSASSRKSACVGKRCIANTAAPRIAGGTATCSPCRAKCGRPLGTVILTGWSSVSSGRAKDSRSEGAGTLSLSHPSRRVLGPVNITVPKDLVFVLILRRLLPRALRGALQHILARHPGVAAAAQRQHTADQYGGHDYEDNDGFEHLAALLRTSL